MESMLGNVEKYNIRCLGYFDDEELLTKVARCSSQ